MSIKKDKKSKPGRVLPKIPAAAVFQTDHMGIKRIQNLNSKIEGNRKTKSLEDKVYLNREPDLVKKVIKERVGRKLEYSNKAKPTFTPAIVDAYGKPREAGPQLNNALLKPRAQTAEEQRFFKKFNEEQRRKREQKTFKDLGDSLLSEVKKLKSSSETANSLAQLKIVSDIFERRKLAAAPNPNLERVPKDELIQSPVQRTQPARRAKIEAKDNISKQTKIGLKKKLTRS